MSAVVTDHEPVAAASDDGPATVVSRWRRRFRWPHRLTVVVVAVGLLATVGLCLVSRLNYLHSERRQVSVQAELAASALGVGPVDIQRRLGRPATLAAATGDLGLFEDAIKASLPSPFASVELFKAVDGTPQPSDSLGDPPLLDASSDQMQDILGRALSSGSLALTRIATDAEQRFGYAMATTVDGETYVAYAEQVLPGNRHVQISASSPLSDLNFALYYSDTQNSDTLLETNVSEDDLPIDSGTLAHVTIPYGDQVLTGVVVPRKPLLGVFAASVAWLILGAGFILTVVMAVLTERLQRRRAIAERLASVTGELYRTQRGVAETLQTALLPKDLPRPSNLAIATRYLAGTEGIEVGGDWYDLVTLPDNRVFFTIGDVSGRGLSAATMMSRLRHSIAAYAVEGNAPATVLAKVSGIIDLARDQHFATALCGILDLGTGTVSLANAGHPPLVLVSADGAETVQAPIGPPLGVGTSYRPAQITLSSGDILLAYTDGLIERRGESIDDGIAHLCEATRRDGDLESLLDTVLATLVPHGASEDDTAILGLQWTP